MNDTQRLNPGRHRLTRDEVRTNQRKRIFAALETAMAEKGYVDTSVADVIKGAGVSRQTFYQLFRSKEDCFLASFARRQGTLIDLLLSTPESDGPMKRFETLLSSYLAAMVANPAVSRLYLVGVYAAGPEAVAARLELQQQFVEGVVMVFDARTDQDRFTCQALVATISTLVTNALLDDDPRIVLDLHQPLVDVARKMMAPR